MYQRISKYEWATEIIEACAKRSTCLKRQVGCILLDHKWRVLSTGYNGAPSGVPSCDETGVCHRERSKSGENLGDCIAVHAEQNAILQCKDVDSIYAAFVTTLPCDSCMRLLLNTPVKYIFYKDAYKVSFAVLNMVAAKGVELKKL
jgi:dCMP deaminase